MKPIVVGPTNTTVKVGEDARFECKVAPSDLQHHTQWLKHYTVNRSFRKLLPLGGVVKIPSSVTPAQAGVQR